MYFNLPYKSLITLLVKLNAGLLSNKVGTANICNRPKSDREPSPSTLIISCGTLQKKEVSRSVAFGSLFDGLAVFINNKTTFFIIQTLVG